MKTNKRNVTSARLCLYIEPEFMEKLNVIIDKTNETKVDFFRRIIENEYNIAENKLEKIVSSNDTISQRLMNCIIENIQSLNADTRNEFSKMRESMNNNFLNMRKSVSENFHQVTETATNLKDEVAAVSENFNAIATNFGVIQEVLQKLNNMTEYCTSVILMTLKMIFKTWNYIPKLMHRQFTIKPEIAQEVSVLSDENATSGYNAYLDVASDGLESTKIFLSKTRKEIMGTKT